MLLLLFHVTNMISLINALQKLTFVLLSANTRNYLDLALVLWTLKSLCYVCFRIHKLER